MTLRLKATMNRPQSRVPSSDSAISSKFMIPPLATSRRSPKPEVKAETLVVRPIINRFGRLVSAALERQVLDMQGFDADHVDQGEAQDQDQRRGDRPHRVGAVAAAEVEQQPITEPGELGPRPAPGPRAAAPLVDLEAIEDPVFLVVAV